MKIYDVAIIGGGVAGFFSAIQLLQNFKNLHIIILEKNNESLKKLLITGKGACNFSHSGAIQDYMDKYGNNGKYLKNAFYNFFVEDIISFFEENGINTFCREDGKHFPSSMKASEIKDLFLKKTKDISIEYNCNINNITKANNVFTISSDKITVVSKRVVITTGGKSFENTGSSGDGYTFAKKFGHTIIKPKPALANIQIKEKEILQFSGISFPHAMIKLKSDTASKKYLGALLITHKGLSGPVIIDNSRDFNVGDTLNCNFVNEKKEILEEALKQQQNQTIQQTLTDFKLPKKLLDFFCKCNNIDPHKKNCEISVKKRRLIIEYITDFKCTISHIEGFESCMCTCGGISLSEIDPTTFESKLEKGLYFLGEVIDIDGNTGGYNLQAIWSECALFAKKFT